jgi:DinB superfamily
MKATLLLLFAAVLAPAADMTVARMYDSQLKGIESEVASLVKAMPADKFSFAPANGEFKGVRTFAQQSKHLAAVIYMVAAAALEEKPPLDLGGENGPANVQTKEQIVAFVQGAFDYAHKAMNGLTAENGLQMVKSPFGGPDMARAGVANIAIWHTMDHYGQMVVYARMNGVVPPASR